MKRIITGTKEQKVANKILRLVIPVLLCTVTTGKSANHPDPVNPEYIAVPSILIIPHYATGLILENVEFEAQATSADYDLRNSPLEPPPPTQSQESLIRPRIIVVSPPAEGIEVGGTIPATPTPQSTNHNQAAIGSSPMEEEWQAWAQHKWWDISKITPPIPLGSGASEAILDDWAALEAYGYDVRDIFGSQDDGTREALIEMMDQQRISYKPEDIVNSLDAYVTGMKNKIERYRALIKVTGVAAAGV
ncbi:MAG: hypothetical protein LBJ77_04225, partial [Holosporales bacterium]|nr:hypothetical protein [Holosporales bacterium]